MTLSDKEIEQNTKQMDLDGKEVCLHKHTKMCPSMTMIPCNICIDCGEHISGKFPLDI